MCSAGAIGSGMIEPKIQVTTLLQLAPSADGSILVSGEIDLSNADVFEAAILEAWDGGTDLVLDISNVTFIGITGAHTLMRLAKVAHREISLRGARPSVVRLLRLIQVDEREVSIQLDAAAMSS